MLGFEALDIQFFFKSRDHVTEYLIIRRILPIFWTPLAAAIKFLNSSGRPIYWNRVATTRSHDDREALQNVSCVGIEMKANGVCKLQQIVICSPLNLQILSILG